MSASSTTIILPRNSFKHDVHYVVTFEQLEGHGPATSLVHYTTSCNTQSSTPEDGQNNCLEHVELTGVINKPLLLHLVGCLYYFFII